MTTDLDGALAAVRRIAAHLDATAIWHEDRCTWIGIVPDDPTAPAPRTFTSLGADVYSGTAGVAVFLADAARVTGDERSRQLARGALRHSFRHHDAIPALGRFGFYAGWAGLLWSAARVTTALGEPTGLDEAGDLLGKLASETPGPEFDLMSGAAGTVAVLAAARPLFDTSVADEVADRAATWLLENAVRSEGTLAWRAPASPDQRPLTGFSHGTAGVGYALAELTGTANVDLAVEARGCFAYERRWFDAERENWPDFRDVVSAVSMPGEVPASALWCHGSGGIALSRLWAGDRIVDDELAGEVDAAVRTTRWWTERSLSQGDARLSLCHGLAGNADLLLETRRASGDESITTPEAVAAELLTAPDDLVGRLSVGEGDTAGLLLGLAGMGHFLLRLSDPSVPTVLGPRLA